MEDQGKSKSPTDNTITNSRIGKNKGDTRTMKTFVNHGRNDDIVGMNRFNVLVIRDSLTDDKLICTKPCEHRSNKLKWPEGKIKATKP